MQKTNKETCGHLLLADKIKSPAKPHVDGSLSGFGRPWGSADPKWHPLRNSFLWTTDRWALVLLLCVPLKFCWFGMSFGPWILVSASDLSEVSFYLDLGVEFIYGVALQFLCSHTML